jgi:hypothetical protein
MWRTPKNHYPWLSQWILLLLDSLGILLPSCHAAWGQENATIVSVAWSLFPMMQLSCRWDDYRHHFKKVWKLLHGLASSYRHNRVLVNKSGMFLDITNHEWHNPNLVPLSNKYRCYLFDKFSLSMRCYKRLAFKARVFMQGCIRIRLCLLLIER